MNVDEFLATEPAATEAMSTNPNTVAQYTIRIVYSSVTLAFLTIYSEFIQILNLKNDDTSKAWW